MSDSEDKKRNKLGYQRISIACAHCRRRKIRCLVAEDDSQDRCQNCIRLKKECVFYPVDQQQMLDTRSQSSAKSGVASVPSSAVSPSPPELASGRPFERSRQYGSFPSIPPLPSNAPSNFAMPLGHGGPLPGQNDLIPSHPAHSLSNHEPVGLPPSEYAFQQTPTDNQRHWDQAGDFSSPSAHMTRPRDSMQSQYWARSSPTVASTADFAPFPTAGPPAAQMQHSDGHFQYPIPQAQTWSQPQAARSMSYGHLQEAGHPGYMPSGVGYPSHPAHEAHSTNAAPYGSSAAPQAPTLASNTVAMGNPMMPFGQPHNPYMFQNPGSVSASPVSNQHPYGNQWYGEQSGYHPSEQDLRSSAEQRSFSGRPSQ